jgi:hypothetical protein
MRPKTPEFSVTSTKQGPEEEEEPEEEEPEAVIASHTVNGTVI